MEEGGLTLMEVDVAEVAAVQTRPPATEDDPSGLRRYDILDDISIAANAYLLRGFDAFERCVLSQWALEGEERQTFLERSLAFSGMLRERLDTALASFEEEALQSCLYVVPSITVAETEHMLERPQSGLTEADEQQLDEDVDALMRQIQEARMRIRRLRREKQALTMSLALHGDTAGLESVVNMAAAKENITEDAAAILDGALRLQPLLAQAEALEQDLCNKPGAATSSPVRGVDEIEREIQKRRAAAGGATAKDLRAFQELLVPN